ncbi:MAG: hypothetical protein IPJ81_16235 [Chitinophagaceae bacterium]|nr:hypothetical protein [Chitinophagaceae bacterium]
MTAEYLIQRFIEHGEKMRIAQKRYFATKSYEAEKKKNFYYQQSRLKRNLTIYYSMQNS